MNRNMPGMPGMRHTPRPGADSRMMPTRPNGQPALAVYVRVQDDGYVLNTLQVFDVTASGISRTSLFQDQDLFAYFNLPGTIADTTKYPSKQEVDICRQSP